MHGKASLRRVRINSQGYDASGAYWGVGMPLWHCSTEDSDAHVRAYDREHAKEKLLKQYPALIFNAR